MTVKYLSDYEINTVIRLAPLVSIDLIIRDGANRVLLGLRNNEPAKGHFFVPGGIILKDETLAEAFSRIMQKEISQPALLDQARLLGVFDHFYPTNRADDPGYGTRYVVLAHEIRLQDISRIAPDAQHSEIGWWTEADLLISDRVHANTKAYFR
jgi:colanic acid biosynthesis protein WcaH